eukprot:TRINITY_DN12622_c0_g1_i2.p1 TRINITY_DN12622_c0_g1~~TRINITY_DN12622_c0_g1_i2.p1  ORF type:complete len:174 (+),score=27.31 TRINITY_DN12622_c0_g1_i2:146-667(+)
MIPENDNSFNQNISDNSEDKSFQPKCFASVYSPIFSSARHGCYLELKNALQKGTDPDSRDPHGNTILIIAAQNNFKDIVKLALLFGGNIDGTNHMGNTALHYCSEYGHVELGDYLLRKGAKPFVVNINGLAATQGVKEDKHREYINMTLSFKPKLMTNKNCLLMFASTKHIIY